MTEHDSIMSNRSEYRWILVAALICIIVVVAALAWPQSDLEPVALPAGARQVFRIPPKPAVKPQTSTKKVSEQAVPKEVSTIPSPVAREPDKKPRRRQQGIKGSVAHAHHSKPLKIKSTAIQESRQTPGHGYFIQVGAFHYLARAKMLQAKLLKSGWIISIVKRGKDMHAVWVGPWPSRPDADKAKVRLLHSLKIQGFIIRK